MFTKKRFFKSNAVLTKILAAAVAVLALTFTSCATTSVKPKANAAELEALPYRMTWVINGTDSDGNPSRIIVQGTVHLGNEELIDSIAPEVIEYFENADRLAGELASDDWDNAARKIQVKMSEGIRTGRLLKDELTEEEYDIACSALPSKKQMIMYNKLEPWVMTNLVNAAIMANYPYSSEYALDTIFNAYGLELGKSTIGLDSLDTQINVIAYGDYDTQLIILKSLLDGIIEAGGYENFAEESVTQELVDAYFADDREKIKQLIEDDLSNDEEDYDFVEDYENQLYYNRNEDWAYKFADFLAQGGTTFVYAGAAHFTMEGNVFDYMKKHGDLK